MWTAYAPQAHTAVCRGYRFGDTPLCPVLFAKRIRTVRNSLLVIHALINEEARYRRAMSQPGASEA